MTYVAVAVCAWLGLPLLVFAIKAWRGGSEYVRARWLLLAIYCAMPVAIEVAGRLGFYSPLSAIPVLFAPPIVALMLASGPARTPPLQGFEVKLTSPPEAGNVGDR